jgi:hypothetical protein
MVRDLSGYGVNQALTSTATVLASSNRHREHQYTMEKLFICVSCFRKFKVMNKPDIPDYKQHEVEMNVECPFCFKTNAIVWPQDESLPLVVPIEHGAEPE